MGPASQLRGAGNSNQRHHNLSHQQQQHHPHNHRRHARGKPTPLCQPGSCNTRTPARRAALPAERSSGSPKFVAPVPERPPPFKKRTPQRDAAMLFRIVGAIAAREMSAYNALLLLLWLLFGLAQRWPGPVTKLSVVEQLSRKINSLENSKRKLRRQMADCRHRALLLKDRQQAQARSERDHQPTIQKEDAPRAQKVSPNSDEVLQLLDSSRTMLLDVLSGAIGFAERRNAAVSSLFSELFSETGGDILSQLTDPWKQWAEALATQKDKADQAFTQCLERIRNNKSGLEEFALPTEPQHHPAPEAEWGFDRVFDLVRSRLSEPRSRPESAADSKSLRRGARKVGPSVDPPAGSGDGPSGSSINVVHRPGCPRLAHAQRLRLRLRPPRVPEKKLPRDEDGSSV
ncbi:uncharacterized protein LOC144171539 [Haemaphysalis longicornis]